MSADYTHTLHKVEVGDAKIKNMENTLGSPREMPVVPATHNHVALTIGIALLVGIAGLVIGGTAGYYYANEEAQGELTEMESAYMQSMTPAPTTDTAAESPSTDASGDVKTNPFQ